MFMNGDESRGAKPAIEIDERHRSRELLPQFVQLVGSSNPKDQYQGTLMIRKLLSVDQSPPIDDVIASGVCPTFARLLASPDENCREQAALILGHLAEENANSRDYVISLGAVDMLIEVLKKPTELIGVHRSATWALSNLCRSKPLPDLEKIATAIPTLVALISHSDEEIVKDAMWALSYISDGSNERALKILQYAPIPRLVQLLGSSSTALQNPAIRIIGNIVTGSDAQTQLVINAGALQSFHFLLFHPHKVLRKQVCWTISNITAGTKEQIQAVINANLIPPLLQCMFASEFEVKKEAVWAVANFTCGAAKEQIAYLVQVGGLDQLCNVLETTEAKILVVCLESIENILHFGEEIRHEPNSESNPYAEALRANGGLRKLELLLDHSSQEVYQRSDALLETFFGDRETSELAIEVPVMGTFWPVNAFAFDRSAE